MTSILLDRVGNLDNHLFHQFLCLVDVGCSWQAPATPRSCASSALPIPAVMRGFCKESKKRTKITLLCQFISFFHRSLMSSWECSNREEEIIPERTQQGKTGENTRQLHFSLYVACVLFSSYSSSQVHEWNSRNTEKEQVRDWRQERRKKERNDVTNGGEKQRSRTQKSFLPFVLQQTLDSHALNSREGISLRESLLLYVCACVCLVRTASIVKKCSS